MTKQHEDVVQLKSIDELPLVIHLRDQIEKLTQEKVDIARQRDDLRKQDADRWLAEKLTLQKEIIDLQTRVVELQATFIKIRREVL